MTGGGGGHEEVVPRGERRSPVVVTILVAISLPLLMPAVVSHGERWIVAGAEAVLLVVMLVLDQQDGAPSHTCTPSMTAASSENENVAP